MGKKNNLNYEIIPLTKTKQGTNDWVFEGKRYATVFATGIIDVTDVRNYFRTHVDENGDSYSFTAYIAYLLGQAIKDHPFINVHSWGRKKMVRFDDVDISCIIERQFEGYKRPIPTNYTIRNANNKNWKDIHYELKDTRKQKSDGVQYDKKKKKSFVVRIFTKVPGWLRRIILHRVIRNPFSKKKIIGTIGLTSVGMFLKEAGAGLGLTPHTVSFQVGGTDWRPRFINGELQNREFLGGTFAIDHAVIDGGDAARFIATFRNFFTQAHGIDLSEPANKNEKLEKI